MSQAIAEKLNQLNLSLPQPPKPSGRYVPFTMVPPLLYLSGVTPKADGAVLYKGKVGKDVTKEEAYLAARQCMINQLGTLQAALGDLERIEQFVKVIGFIQADSDFHDLPDVMNGASDLLVELFGERGKHTRSAVGVASLPGGAAVEVELIVQYRM